MHHDITRSLDGSRCVLLVLLDLSAVFDTIGASTLEMTMGGHLGISSFAFTSLSSHMSDCTVNIWTTREPCGGVTMKPVIYVSNLGVQVDTHNSKRHHVDAVRKKCDFHLKRINSTRRYITKRVCHLLVTALVVLIMDYCNVFQLEHYHPTRLQKKHNRCLQIYFYLTSEFCQTLTLLKLR